MEVRLLEKGMIERSNFLFAMKCSVVAAECSTKVKKRKPLRRWLLYLICFYSSSGVLSHEATKQEGLYRKKKPYLAYMREGEVKFAKCILYIDIPSSRHSTPTRQHHQVEPRLTCPSAEIQDSTFLRCHSGAENTRV
jgi:hypothetical protein